LPPVPPQVGLWAVLHEIRSEYAQLLTVAFLLISGPGPLSVDAWLSRKRKLDDGEQLLESKQSMHGAAQA
jgi:putative oxidoreductase